jgi:hypothetical protein
MKASNIRGAALNRFLKLGLASFFLFNPFKQIYAYSIDSMPQEIREFLSKSQSYWMPWCDDKVFIRNTPKNIIMDIEDVVSEEDGYVVRGKVLEVPEEKEYELLKLDPKEIDPKCSYSHCENENMYSIDSKDMTLKGDIIEANAIRLKETGQIYEMNFTKQEIIDGLAKIHADEKKAKEEAGKKQVSDTFNNNLSSSKKYNFQSKSDSNGSMSLLVTDEYAEKIDDYEIKRKNEQEIKIKPQENVENLNLNKANSAKISNLESTVKKVNEKTDQTNKNLKETKQDLSNFKKESKDYQEKTSKSSAAQYNHLNGRINENEKNYSSLDAKVSGLGDNLKKSNEYSNKEIAGLKGDMISVKEKDNKQDEKDNKQDSDIKNLQDNYAELNKKHEKDYKESGTEISLLKTRVDSHDNDIKSLSERTSNNENNIIGLDNRMSMLEEKSPSKRISLVAAYPIIGSNPLEDEHSSLNDALKSGVYTLNLPITNWENFCDKPQSYAVGIEGLFSIDKNNKISVIFGYSKSFNNFPAFSRDYKNFDDYLGDLRFIKTENFETERLYAGLSVSPAEKGIFNSVRLGLIVGSNELKGNRHCGIIFPDMGSEKTIDNSYSANYIDMLLKVDKDLLRKNNFYLGAGLAIMLPYDVSAKGYESIDSTGWKNPQISESTQKLKFGTNISIGLNAGIKFGKK